MGLFLSRTHLHGENNSPQSAFYTNHLETNLNTHCSKLETAIAEFQEWWQNTHP